MDEDGSDGGGDADVNERKCRKIEVDGNGGGQVVYMMSQEDAVVVKDGVHCVAFA